MSDSRVKNPSSKRKNANESLAFQLTVNAMDRNEQRRKKVRKVATNWNMSDRGKIQIVAMRWRMSVSDTSSWCNTHARKTGATSQSILKLAHDIRSDRIGPNELAAALASTAPLVSAPVANTGDVTNVARLAAFSRALNNSASHWTQKQRQSASGGLFETACIAAAAQHAHVPLMFWPSGANFKGTPKNLLSAVERARGTTTGVLVVKAEISLAALKTNETNNARKRAWFGIISAGAVLPSNQPLTGYNNERFHKLNPVPIAQSPWKGFWEAHPDLLFFRFIGLVLHIYIFELKIGSGKAEHWPAEAAQLAKAKGALLLMFPGSVIHAYFYPLMYGLHSSARTNYRDPYSENYVGSMADFFRRNLGANFHAPLIKDAQFQKITGLDPGIMKSMLDVFRMNQLEEIYNLVKKMFRNGIFVRGRNASTFKTLVNVVGNNSVHQNFKKQLQKTARGLHRASFLAKVPPGANAVTHEIASGSSRAPHLVTKAMRQARRMGYYLTYPNGRMVPPSEYEAGDTTHHNLDSESNANNNITKVAQRIHALRNLPPSNHESTTLKALRTLTRATVLKPGVDVVGRVITNARNYGNPATLRQMSAFLHAPDRRAHALQFLKNAYNSGNDRRKGLIESLGIGSNNRAVITGSNPVRRNPLASRNIRALTYANSVRAQGTRA
jgi:hypothetical protein